jgi:hypothetical protein
MKKTKREKISRSAFIVFILFTLAFIYLRDKEKGSENCLLIITFVINQIIIIVLSLVLIFLRITGICKNRCSMIYCFLGIFQVFLAISDACFLATDHSLSWKVLSILFIINFLSGLGMFLDILKNQKSVKLN